MPAKCIGGPPAALPYQYLMMGKPQSLTLTGEEAVLRMPSPDSKGSAARATIQRQQELDALMAGGPPLWSPQHPNFGDPLAVSATVGGVACGGEGEEDEAAMPSASPSLAASQRTAAAATAHASSSASLTPTMEHYHANGMHSHANYAQRLFDEILEARHRRLQEYEAAQWDQTDPQHVQKARQMVAQLQQEDDDDDSESESDRDGNEEEGVTQRENAAAPAASSSSSPLLDPSSHMKIKQRREKERTDEEEIARLQRRAANKKAKASRAAYHAALVADLSPFVSQLLWKGLEQEMTLRAQQQWEAEDLKLRQMNEEEGLRREAARLAEDTMHAAVVAERERRYFDTVDPVMSQLRKDAEARRQAAAAREAEKEAQELEELEQRLQALTNPTNNNNSAAPRATHNSSSSAKQQPNSALNEQLRAQQRRLKQQMDDAARYEEPKQNDAEEIEQQPQQQQARLSRPSSTTQSSAISHEPLTSTAQPFRQSARPASSKVAADDVRALLNVIELAVDSAEDASLGRGLSLLLQGMDV